MKTYNSKSNATRAMNTYAQKVQADLISAEVIEEAPKQFVVKFKMQSNTADETVEMLKEKFIVSVKPVVTGEIAEYTHCPECGVHLSNGVSDYDTQKHIATQNNAPEAAIKTEFVCLGCNHEFGVVVKEAKAAKSKTSGQATGTGLKIQKDREERNGVKRPSEGGKCAILWNLFDTMYGEKGMVPTPKPAKERSAEIGMDPTTTQVQLYRWREFMGFKGK